MKLKQEYKINFQAFMVGAAQIKVFKVITSHGIVSL